MKWEHDYCKWHILLLLAPKRSQHALGFKYFLNKKKPKEVKYFNHKYLVLVFAVEIKHLYG